MRPLLQRFLQWRFAERASTSASNTRVYDSDRKGRWGQNWFFFPRYETRRLKQCISGHQTPLPRIGDQFHTAMQSGKTGMYEVWKVERCYDPPDLFFADVEFIGYLEERL